MILPKPENDTQSANDFCLNFVFVKQIKSGQVWHKCCGHESDGHLGMQGDAERRSPGEEDAGRSQQYIPHEASQCWPIADPLLQLWASSCSEPRSGDSKRRCMLGFQECSYFYQLQQHGMFSGDRHAQLIFSLTKNAWPLILTG